MPSVPVIAEFEKRHNFKITDVDVDEDVDYSKSLVAPVSPVVVFEDDEVVLTKAVIWQLN